MTQEDKQLLLKDLCARLPYEVKIRTNEDDESYTLLAIHPNKDIAVIGLQFDDVFATSKIKIEDIKPYLRPMSSMTEEEFVYFIGIHGRNLRSYEIQEMMSKNFSHPNGIAIVNTLGRYSHNIDWLNKNMFDYRGLIPKGLAIEVTEENNPYEN